MSGGVPLLGLVLTAMACLAVEAIGPAIVIPPQNVTVKVRGTAMLTCVVEEKGLNKVNWVNGDGLVISTDYEVSSSTVGDRFTIVGEEARGNYSLRITGVIRVDAGWFHCQLVDTDTGSRLAVSEPVRLVVQYAPGQSYPRCLPDYRSTTMLVLGQRLNFTCSSEIGEPPARLEWTRDGETVPAEMATVADRIHLRFDRNVTAEDNGKAFLCTLSHKFLPRPTTCQVGPLDVTFPPMNVTITINSDQLRVGNTPLITCGAQANPRRGLTYTWYVLPASEDYRESQADRFQRQGGYLIITSVEAEDDGTVLVCEARSELGAVNATIALAVLKPPTTLAPTTRAPTPPSHPDTTEAQPVDKASAAPYVIVLILIAVSLLLLTLALVVFALKRKKRPATAVISVRDLDNLHADVHSLASFGNISRQGTPYLDRVDYELGRSRSHSRDAFDSVSLDSASALVAGRFHSQSSPTRRKYSVDSLGKPLGRSTPQSYRNGSPTHGAGKRLDSYPDKERKLSESALSQAGRPLPKINGPVQQNEYAELTPVSARKKYANDSHLSVTSPESGFGEDDSLIKPLNDSFPPPSCNNCNCGGRKVSHVEV